MREVTGRGAVPYVAKRETEATHEGLKEQRYKARRFGISIEKLALREE